MFAPGIGKEGNVNFYALCVYMGVCKHVCIGGVQVHRRKYTNIKDKSNGILTSQNIEFCHYSASCSFSLLRNNHCPNFHLYRFVLSIFELHMHRVIQYVLSCAWLYSLNIRFLECAYPTASVQSFLLVSNMPLYEHHIVWLSYSIVNRHLCFFLFLLPWMKLQ